MVATTKDHGLGKNARFFVIVQSSEDGRTLSIRQVKSEFALPPGVRYTDGWLEGLTLKSREIVHRDSTPCGFGFAEGIKNVDIANYLASEGYTVTII